MRTAQQGINTFLEELERRLLTVSGVNVRFPPHLQPPVRSIPLNLVAGYEDVDRRASITPLIRYTVPADHRAVFRGWAIGVNFFEDEFTAGNATWTTVASGFFEFRRNGSRVQLLNPPGTVVGAGALATSGTPTALVNEASDPTAAAAGGSCTSQLNDNPFGLHKLNPCLVVLEEGETFELDYVGVNAGLETLVDIYVRLSGWAWEKSGDPRA